jgi:hypothetical protein
MNQASTDGLIPRKVLVRGLALFIILNLIFASLPLKYGEISLYNHIFPGRPRLPYGENPAESYNISLFDLDAMFASHMITSNTKPAGEYRVVLIGDSALWGWMLHPDETLAGQLNVFGSTTCDGRTVHVYNLGYPTISLTKDLLILDKAMEYQPDLVIWLFTLEAFPADKQLSPPLVANNASRVDELITLYDLPLDPTSGDLVRPSLWDRSIIGQRRPLADLLRLQLYGILWSATGVDQLYPSSYEKAQTNFDEDVSFHELQPATLEQSSLAFPILEAGLSVVGTTPLLFINEPIMISSGENSNLRYNICSPRWAYDQYRKMLAQKASAGNWNYSDLWDIIPAGEFTNTPFHMTPKGESILANRLQMIIQQQVCP